MAMWSTAFEKSSDMRRFANISAGIALAASALTMVQAAKPEKAIEPGVYGNVSYHDDSGDVSGMEIEIHAGDDRRVETTLCEGECRHIVQSRYERHGDWIEYEYHESPNYIVTYRVKPDGRNVRVEQTVEGYVNRTRLKRLKQRIGLNIAADLEAQPPGAEGLKSGK